MLFSIFKTSNAAMITKQPSIVEIALKRDEKVVACNDLTYIGISNICGIYITLKLGTWHSICADGITSSRFLGYIFKL